MTDNAEQPGEEKKKTVELRASERKTPTERDWEKKREIWTNKRSNLESEDSMKPDYVVSVNDH